MFMINRDSIEFGATGQSELELFSRRQSNLTRPTASCNQRAVNFQVIINHSRRVVTFFKPVATNRVT
jgi:hypothetical protein